MSWGWDYFSTNRTPAIVDRGAAGRIDWGDEADEPDDADATGADDRASVAAPQQDEAAVAEPIRSG
jgi:hypothetical protein